jgi:cytochrome c oxidase cbb3-type subunit III
MNNTAPHDDDKLRHHTYDGIQEYDKRLPNWWLFTLYGAIVFSAAYWAYYHWSAHMIPGYVRVERQIEEIQKAALATGAAPTDIQLWKLSTDPAVTEAGHKIYVANCVACHGENLEGGIGQNLVDNEYVHGSRPTDIYAVIQKGVLEKGMPVWGPVLGAARIADVTAYILSRNPYTQKPAEE